MRYISKVATLLLFGIPVCAACGDEPKTFREAYSQVERLLDESDTAVEAAMQAKIRLSDETDDDVKTALKEEVDRLVAKIYETQSSIKKSLQLALKLADDSSPVEQVNRTRYYLCHHLFASGDYEEADRIGMVGTTGDAKAPEVLAMARIVMASRGSLLDRAREIQAAEGVRKSGDDITEARRRLGEIARLIVAKWPDTEAATHATEVLKTFVEGELPPLSKPTIDAGPLKGVKE